MSTAICGGSYRVGVMEGLLSGISRGVCQCGSVTGAKPEYAPERTGIFRFRCVFAFRQNRNRPMRCQRPRLPVRVRARPWQPEPFRFRQGPVATIFRCRRNGTGIK